MNWGVEVFRREGSFSYLTSTVVVMLMRLTMLMNELMKITPKKAISANETIAPVQVL